MAKQTINLGTAPAGTDGDVVRTGFDKANKNFDELYTRAQGKLTKSIAGGAGTVNLTAAEALNGFIDLTGAITGNKVVVVPLTPTMRWIVRNSTTGNFSVTFQTAAGAGVVIPRGAAMMFQGDAAGIIVVSPVPGVTVNANGDVLVGKPIYLNGNYAYVAGTMDVAKNVNAAAATTDNVAPFHTTGELGSAFTEWATIAQPAMQVDCPGNLPAYMLARWTKWGERHLAAIHCYSGGGSTTTPDISFSVGTMSRAFVFDGQGRAYATSFNPTSDARLKRGIAPIEDAGAKLDGLSGCTWERIDILDDGGRRYAGVLAQDVQAVLPEGVSVCDEFLTVDPMAIIAIVINALKEERAARQAMASDMESLKQRLAALEASA